MRRAGIYLITNLATGKRYVGQSTNLAFRFTRHRYELRSGKHGNRYLQAAWDKYREPRFEFSILCYVDDGDIDTLNRLERDHIARLGSFGEGGYNLTTGGLNRRVSAETRKRLSESHKGKPGRPMSEATKTKLRVINTGRPLTAEHRAKLSDTLKGKPGWNKGRRGDKLGPASAERWRKIGDAQRGSKNHNFGKTTPESVKAKLRASLQGSKCHLAKLDEAKVLDIKRRLAAGERPSVLADEHKVRRTQISCIKHNQTWRHVPWPPEVTGDA